MATRYKLATQDRTETLSNKNILTGINIQSGTSYTLQLSDAGKLIQTTSTSNNTVTIPTDLNVPFPVGTRITIQKLPYDNTTTITGDSGVSILYPGSVKLVITEQYGKRTLLKIDTNQWIVLSDGKLYNRIGYLFSTTTSITPDKFEYDEYYIDGLQNNITINNATSPSLGDTFLIYLTDNGTARSISFGNHYVGIGAALPTTTTANKTMEIIIKYVGSSKALISYTNQA